MVIWFDDAPAGTQQGAVLYASGPAGVLATTTIPRVFPSDIDQESAELLSLYGAAVHDLAYQAVRAGLPLPAELRRWGELPDRPTAALGRWQPTLLALDGRAHLALARPFANLIAYALTTTDLHIAALAPRGNGAISLRARRFP